VLKFAKVAENQNISVISCQVLRRAHEYIRSNNQHSQHTWSYLTVNKLC